MSSAGKWTLLRSYVTLLRAEMRRCIPEAELRKTAMAILNGGEVFDMPAVVWPASIADAMRMLYEDIAFPPQFLSHLLDPDYDEEAVFHEWKAVADPDLDDDDDIFTDDDEDDEFEDEFDDDEDEDLFDDDFDDEDEDFDDDEEDL